MAVIRVLIVDDSALIRKILTEILNSDPELEVVGTAMDPYIAREKIKALRPDVITLDVEMPRMDGITFLGNLMRLNPLPVVMVSSLTEKGAELTMNALSMGAVDFVSKPKVDPHNTLDTCAPELISKVKNASKARVKALVRSNGAAKPNANAENVVKVTQSSDGTINNTKNKLIAIGASTGGTLAIKEILVNLEPNCPGIVIAQHIPPVFSKSFADNMNQCSRLKVCEAKDGQEVLPGHVYISPGDRHLEVRQENNQFFCKLNDGVVVNRHKPAVDVLFDSVAGIAKQNAMGVILTGMGTDGARGIKKMRNAGSLTIAQDKKTSIVWGMPGSAVDEDGIDLILPLSQIAPKLQTFGGA